MGTTSGSSRSESRNNTKRNKGLCAERKRYKKYRQHVAKRCYNIDMRSCTKCFNVKNDTN